MHRFSRPTIIRAFDLLDRVIQYHADLTKFALLFSLEDALIQQGGIRAKLVMLMKYVIDNQELKGPNGDDLIFEIIEYAIKKTITDYDKGSDEFIDLENSLRRDGYLIEDRQLKKALPEIIQLP